MAINLTNTQLKALTETPERKTYTVAIATIAMVVLLTFLAIRPAIASILDRLDENDKLRDVKSQLDIKYENLLTLNKSETERAAQLKVLDAAMPTSKNEELLYANLMELVNRNNVNFISISFSPETGKSSLDATVLGNKTEFRQYTLSVNGTRTDVTALLSDIESFPRVMNVNRVTITPDQASGLIQGNEVKADIEVEFYYYEQ